MRQLKNWIGGSIFWNTKKGNKKGGEIKYKSCRGTEWDSFIFIFSQSAIMVTDTAFTKFSLWKLLLNVVVSGTCKHWSYHTGLLVFCLKVKLSTICKCLNYYYNIINDYYQSYIYKQVLINKVFDSTYKWNIQKINESLADTVNLCMSRYSIERSQGQHKHHPDVVKIGLANSENLVKLW